MNQNRKNWSDFEDKAIGTLVKRHGTKNWAQISEKMSSKYGIENRSGKQCRERWHNHLDPTINKQTWTPKQQKLMFEAHQKYGNRWTQIAKLFPGRTDNDIKNHFYSMLRRSLRRINKMLGRRNSTQKIKEIKPSVLSKIFINIGVKDERKSQDCKRISEALFQFSSTKPDSDLSQSLDFEEKKRLQDLIERLSDYNDEYELSQLQKKESKRSQNMQSEVKVQTAPILAPANKKESEVSNKSKKIRRVIRRKKQTKEEEIKVQESEEVPKRIRMQVKKQKKKGSFGGVSEKNQEKQPEKEEEEKVYMTRLRKSESGMSFGEDFLLPDLLNIPPEFNKLSSSSQQGTTKFKKNSSMLAHSPGFGLSTSSNIFIGPSPRGQFRNWTPLCPSPNIGDLFNRGAVNYEWKDNNDDLDNIMHQLKRKIEQSSKPE